MSHQTRCYYNIVDANLNAPPATKALHPHEFCSIGDMHGNPIKFIWILMYLGILVFPEPQSQFSKLLELYQLDVSSVNKDVIDEFYDLLANAQFHPEQTHGLILIGDLLADRGQNDYFTLKVFEVLTNKQIPFEILLSNHDVNTIIFSERPPNVDKLIDLEPEFNRSLINLAHVLNPDRALFEDIVNIMDAFYKPKLIATKLVHINQQHYLFSHGVFDILIFNKIVRELKIPFEPNSIESFQEALGLINKILNVLLSKQQYHLIHGLLHRFIWNRELTPTTQAFLRTHRIHLIHGHIGETHIPAQEAKYHTNLDTNIGRPVHTPIQNKGHLKLFFHQVEEQKTSHKEPKP